MRDRRGIVQDRGRDCQDREGIVPGSPLPPLGMAPPPLFLFNAIRGRSVGRAARQVAATQQSVTMPQIHYDVRIREMPRCVLVCVCVCEKLLEIITALAYLKFAHLSDSAWRLQG